MAKRKPSDLSDEEAVAAAAELADEFRAAAEQDAWLFRQQVILLESEEESLESEDAERPAFDPLILRMLEEGRALFDNLSPSTYICDVLVPPGSTSTASMLSAGGYSIPPFTLTFEGCGSLKVTAQWTSKRINLAWEYTGIRPSSHLIVAFCRPGTTVLLGPPKLVGQIRRHKWSASAEDLDVKLDSRWGLVFLVATND